MSNIDTAKESDQPKKSLVIKNKGKKFVITEGDGGFDFCFTGFGEKERIINASSSVWINKLYAFIDSFEKAEIVKIHKAVYPEKTVFL